MEANDGAIISSAILIENLVNTIHVAFRIHLNTVCNAVTVACATVSDASRHVCHSNRKSSTQISDWFQWNTFNLTDPDTFNVTEHV